MNSDEFTKSVALCPYLFYFLTVSAESSTLKSGSYCRKEKPPVRDRRRDFRLAVLLNQKKSELRKVSVAAEFD